MSCREGWAVIGGGLLGMTVASTLAKAGRQVTLFEAGGKVGGLASSWQIGDITWDRYYHVTLYSDANTREVLTELNLDQSMCWKKTKTSFYHAGRLLPFSSTLDFARFPLLTPFEKLRLGATILYASRFQDWQRLRSVSVEDWLTSLSGKSVFQKIWRPLLRAKLGDDYRTTSSTFIWATIQRMYAARQSGLREERFGYLPGGYGRMLSAYEQSLKNLGVQIRLNSKIQQVTASAEGLKVTFPGQEAHHFERVIITTPAAVATQLCPELTDQETESLKHMPYLGIICASALLKRSLSDSYITNILDESIPFTGLIEMSALVDPSEFGNQHLLYIPRYVRPDHPDFLRPEEELASDAKESLIKMYPKLTEDDFITIRVSRSRYVFPRPTTDSAQQVPPVDTSVPGLSILNSSHILNGTLNVNETVALAKREALRLHASHN